MRRLLKSIWSETALLGVCVVVVVTGSEPASALTTPGSQPWDYLLVTDAYLLDDCPICDRVSIAEPMRGTFSLRLVETTPLFSRYAVENIDFRAGSTRTYTVKGGGTFQIGGEVALVQEMSLQVEIDDGFTQKLCDFSKSSPLTGRPWPMMDMTVEQTNGTLAHTYSLRLAAAPVREIWFSTESSFTASSEGSGPAFVLGGDLISSSGRVVKRNADLFTSVGAFPPGPDLGLDAVDILPGGEIAFSLVSGIISQTLGPLQSGDLLSNRGLILQRNQDLLAPFGAQPPVPDVGLDAVHILDSGEILFSIGTTIFSERLGVTLQRGDLLSNKGQVVRTNKQLLERFHPPAVTKDYGLDALYVWPSGEIWFSTEQGFQDQTLGAVLGGDLLSDQGYIVFRNLELLRAFAPDQDPIDFGLDALYIVTDATPPTAPPRLAIAIDPATQSVGLTWQGLGRVFQVERATELTDPFQPLSPIISDLFFDDLGALTRRPESYYRVRQW